MKIIFIYPALNPRVNDISRVPIYLVRRGHDAIVITSRTDKLKSVQNDKLYEECEGLKIYRPYNRFNPDMIYRPFIQKNLLREIIYEFKPDVLVCSQEYTIKLGLLINGLLQSKIPIVVVSEFAGNLMDHGYPGIIANITFPLIGLPRGKRFWPWLCKVSNAIITCYYGDIQRLKEFKKYITPVYYIPWCDQLPENFSPKTEKDKDLAVYIGAFSRWKHTDYFSEIVPAILEGTPTRKIIFVGKGKTGVIEKLRHRYGSQIDYIPGLTREAALDLISRAYYGITPVKRGGWGFIGDCWAVRTPLVSMYNDYNLNNKKDAIVAQNHQGLVEGINSLYTNSDLYKRIQKEGFARYENYHTAIAVGKAYEDVLFKTLSQNNVE